MYAAAPNPKREKECRNPLLCAASNNLGLKMSSMFVIYEKRRGHGLVIPLSSSSRDTKKLKYMYIATVLTKQH